MVRTVRKRRKPGRSHMARLVALLDDMDINYCINKEPNEDYVRVSLMMSDESYGECYSFYFDLKGNIT